MGGALGVEMHGCHSFPHLTIMSTLQLHLNFNLCHYIAYSLKILQYSILRGDGKYGSVGERNIVGILG